MNDIHYPEQINHNKQVKFEGYSTYNNHYKPF